MKAAVFSDLHLQAANLDYDLTLPDDVEVVIVAGDVHAPVRRSMSWLAKRLEGRQIVFVAGNHEHYGQVYEESMQSGYDARSAHPDVHFLENSEFVLGDVRFLGATMWTDFGLYGEFDEAMFRAQYQMNDYVQTYSTDAEGQLRRWTPARTLALHLESREWLRGALAAKHDGPTVVVTHHAPTPMSVASDFEGNPLNPAFISDLTEVIEEFQPNLWVHGHTHSSFDYMVPGTETRVICNPRGYVREYHGGSTAENKAFDPFLVIEI